MRKIVVAGCDGRQLPYASVALKCFQSKNLDFDMGVLSRTISDENKRKLEAGRIVYREVDLSADFIHLDRRPYGRQYPLECFYHLAAYRYFDSYDYVVSIEADMFTNKPLDIDYASIRVVGAVSDGSLIKDYPPIVSDLSKIGSAFGELKLDQPRALGGLKVYNVAGCRQAELYEKMVVLYQRSCQLDAPRCGDDSLTALYQSVYPDQFHLLPRKYNYIGMSGELPSNIVIYHDAQSPHKWWHRRTDDGTLSSHFHGAFNDYVAEADITI